jgi:serine/threonine-protein kinase
MTDLASLQVALEGRYTIERELGAGGMATVFLAEDVRHRRNVALKVLRPELAAVIGAERFLAEIETTANLQHPHILPLFDSGEVDGTVFYVMPYVEGESLRDRLDREKQLPVVDAVRLTSEIASALDYAHRHDVIHRDIKPENILLHEGQAMVADFGIALAASGAGATRMTETGMSLGTPHYMSPEQAMGEREITARSDVYALGVMLYEMLVGEPPFNGPTAQAIVAQVVTESPRGLVARRGTIPVNVEAAALTALEKLPADRFATAAEFSAALANPAFTRPTDQGAPSAQGGRDGWRMLALGLSGVSIVLLLVTMWAVTSRTEGTGRTGTSYQPIRIWNYRTTSSRLSRDLGLAPDGSAIVYRDTTGADRLWLKERSEPEPVPLAGTDRGLAPFFSPDGRWIAFSATGRLLKVPRRGGSAIVLSDSGGADVPGVWFDDGTIVFTNSDKNLLFRVTESGEEHQRVLNAESRNLSIAFVTGVPGEREVLLGGCTNLPCARGNVYRFDAATGDLQPVVEQAAGAWYAPPDILLYSRTDGGVFATPFDARTLTTHGAAVPVLSGVRTGGGLTDIVIGGDGTAVYVMGQSNAAAAESQAVWIDRLGVTTPVDSAWTGEFVINGGPALSPDGTRIAVSLVDAATGEGHLFVKQLPDGPLSRLTFEGAQNLRPSWSPDGRDVLFVSNRGAGGKMEVWRQPAGGGRQAVRLVSEERPVFEAYLIPGGEWLLFRTDDLAAGRGDIYGRRLRGDTATVALVATPFEETSPTVSPNGRWLAYTSDKTGQKEVYVRPFPNTDDGLFQVSAGGGIEPIWSQAGTELFYRTRAGDVISAQVATEGDFVVGERSRLFRRGGAYVNDDSRFWAARADGQRFLMVVPVSAGVPQTGMDVVMVRGWFTTVRDAVTEANE